MRGVVYYEGEWMSTVDRLKENIWWRRVKLLNHQIAAGNKILDFAHFFKHPQLLKQYDLNSKMLRVAFWLRSGYKFV